MSQEDVDLVIGQFEGINVRDFATVRDAWTEDMTLVPHSDVLGLFGGVVTGKEAVGEFFADVFSQFASDWRAEVEESRDLGDRVLIVATHHARGRTSGLPYTAQNTYLYTLRGGKISRMEIWDDREEALKAAGLSE
jgi:ketosteroid isomerase-like protein